MTSPSGQLTGASGQTLRQLGAGGPFVPSVCFCTSPLGGSPLHYGSDVAADRAIETVQHMLTSSVHFIDTSNEYGRGASEARIGQALALGPVPDDLVLATKADPASHGAPLDGARVRESFAESTGRLGVRRFPVYYLHDPERYGFAEMTSAGGCRRRDGSTEG